MRYLKEVKQGNKEKSEHGPMGVKMGTEGRAIMGVDRRDPPEKILFYLKTTISGNTKHIEMPSPQVPESSPSHHLCTSL